MISLGDNNWIVENVNSNMAMEGMPLEDEDRRRILDCLEGKKTFQEAVEELVAYYQNGKAS